MNPPPLVLYNVPIFDFANPPSTIPGLTIAACTVGDVNCPTGSELELAPAVGPTPTMIMVAGLAVSVPVYTLLIPYGVDAYLRINAPGYLQFEYPLGGPLVSKDLGAMLTPLPQGTPGIPPGTMAVQINAAPLTPVKEKDADRFANGIGVNRDPNGAIIAVRVVDCQDNPAAGVTLELQPPAQGITSVGLSFSYLSNQPLSTDPPSPTDSNGIVGFANIKLTNGLQNLNPRVEATAPNGAKYGQTVLEIRPNQLSSIEVRPQPGVFGH